MNQPINLCPYLPAQTVSPSIRRRKRRGAASLLLALEALISLIIGVSVLIGVAALLLML